MRKRAFALTLAAICLACVLPVAAVTGCKGADQRAPDAAVGQSVEKPSQQPEETLPPGLPTYIINVNWRTRWIIYGDGVSIEKETITDEIKNMGYGDRNDAYLEFNSNNSNYDYFFSSYDSLSPYDNGGFKSYFVGEREITRYVIGNKTDSIEYRGGTLSKEIPIYKYKLSDKDRHVLLKDYDHLSPANRSADADSFIGIRDDQIELLDYDGNVILSVEKPPEANAIFALTNGLYVYGYNSSETAETFWWEQPDNYTEALLGPDLEELIPLGKYTEIYMRRYYHDGIPVELLFGNRFIRPVLRNFGHYNDTISMYRTDIFSMSGELMIEGLTRVFGVTPDRIAVIRGAYGGLMDWSGNWIVKIPIYTDFMDD